MTNEEKARDIALCGKPYFSNDYEHGMFDGAEEMAERKDRQFKEYLYKLEDECDKAYKEASNDEYELGEAYGRLCMVVEIINELFKKD